MPIRPLAVRLPRHRLDRRGFSFTEILFAVMILGIGFIMVVAIFPVALAQTETSQAETVAAAVARAGVSFVSQNSTMTFVDQSNVTASMPLVDLSILRPTVPLGADDYVVYTAATTGAPVIPLAPVPPGELVGEVWSFDSLAGGDLAAYVSNPKHDQPLSPAQPMQNVLWPLMAQNMIHSADPRYAWVAFYRRNLIQTATAPLSLYAYAPSAQLIVIAIKSQAKQFYDQSDLRLSTVSPAYPTSIQPSLGRAVILPPSGTSLSYTIQFTDTVLKLRAAEGAFVIISSDLVSPGIPGAGFLNGRIYRLGIRVTDAGGAADKWEFAPGYGPPLAAAGSSAIPDDAAYIANGHANYRVYMIGKAIDPNDQANPPTTYAGLAQDVAAYSTFISLPSN